MQRNTQQRKATSRNAAQHEPIQTNIKQCKPRQNNANQHNALQGNTKHCKPIYCKEHKSDLLRPVEVCVAPIKKAFYTGVFNNVV